MSAVALLAAFAVAFDNTPQSPFCRDYLTVLGQAYRGFREFRSVTEADLDQPDDMTYQSSFNLPGATCEIQENEFEYNYQCSWKQADTLDWQETIKQARVLADAVAECSQLRLVVQGESQSGTDLNWRAMVGFPYNTRTHVEVTASNFEARSRTPPKRLAYVGLAIRYRRETHP